MKNIHKRFASTIALDGVNLTANAGEIRGLIGENGSGKSTISSIAAGMQKADEGEMMLNGEPWNPSSMIDALEHGVGMIVQENGTVPGITVAENLFLGEIGQFKKGMNIKNCILCKFYKYEWCGKYLCIRYKSLGEKYHFPKQTTAKTCPSYKENQNLLKHSLSELEKEVLEVPM